MLINRTFEKTKLLQMTSTVQLAEVKLQDHLKSGQSCKDKLYLQIFMLCSSMGFISLSSAAVGTAGEQCLESGNPDS